MISSNLASWVTQARKYMADSKLLDNTGSTNIQRLRKADTGQTPVYRAAGPQDIYGNVTQSQDTDGDGIRGSTLQKRVRVMTGNRE